MVTYEFKQATAQDALMLVELDYELFPDSSFNERTLERQVSVGLCYFLEVNRYPAGYILTSDPTASLVDILRLGIREQFRQCGLATVLLDNVLRLGKDTMLTVRQENTPALNLYRKHQFEIVGVMPQHASWVMIRPGMPQ